MEKTINKLKFFRMIDDQLHTGVNDNKTVDSFGRITMSIGVARYASSDLPNILIQRADSALYLAKERGRNRVERAI